MPDNTPLFVMAGGGTGGHVIPAIAVARQLVSAGCKVKFIGTERGAEARLVPASGFPIEMIRVGGLKNLGLATKITSVGQLLSATMAQFARFGKQRPSAVFSMGGYVAGPVVLAALLHGIPLVIMEPNAMPGATNKWVAKWVRRALISFSETAKYFPAGRTEVTGLPVREEFFHVPARVPDGVLNILITGGSQGSRTLNEAARASWPLFREAGLPLRFVHQTGTAMCEAIRTGFAETGLAGTVSAFITDMPGAFAEADLIVCRAGAGAVAELAAAGKPAVLIPFPFAADDHQLKNAQAFEKAGAAVLFRDQQWTGQQFFETVQALLGSPDRLQEMGRKARELAKPGAARRAAEIVLKESGVGPQYRLTDMRSDRNNG